MLENNRVQMLQSFLIGSVAIVSYILVEIYAAIPQSLIPALTVKSYFPVGSDSDWKRIPTPYIHKSFTEEQKATLSSASRILDDIILSQATRNCIDKYTTYLQGSGMSVENSKKMPLTTFAWIAERMSKKYTGPYSKGGHLRMLFKPITEDSSTLAQTEVNIDYKTRHPIIEVNTVQLNNKQRTTQSWAGTIFHELLHTYGYTHPKVPNQGNTDQRFGEVYGNFVYESGWCVNRANADKRPNSFGLTGSNSEELFVD
jgi:hypothetical protein